jgi:hypothetical protein
VNGNRVGRRSCWGADVAGADHIEPGKIIGPVVYEGDASSVQHLQEKIPYQAVSLFDFVEKQDALLVSCEHLAKATDTAGFVAHKELHIVQVNNEAADIVAFLEDLIVNDRRGLLSFVHAASEVDDLLEACPIRRLIILRAEKERVNPAISLLRNQVLSA